MSVSPHDPGSHGPTEQVQAQWRTLAAPRVDETIVTPDETVRPSQRRRATLTRQTTLPRFTGDAHREPEVTLKSKLGEGGMGVVFLAHQTSLARDVAVKSVRPASADPQSTGALLQEAWVSGILEHPNVVPIYALGEDEDGLPLLVMKRIEGVSWQAVLDGRAPMPRCQARCPVAARSDLRAHIKLLQRACAAVRFAHSKGILHCDLKPDNVMIGDFGEVYVLDWGIAVSLRPDPDGRFPLANEVRDVVGTPAYMSPEQAAGLGSCFSEATDVYALGAILHRLITGRPRHDGPELQAALYSAYMSEPFAYGPEVPSELAALCNRAMAREPDERFPDVAAFTEALRVFVEHWESERLARETVVRLQDLRAHMGGSLEQTQLETGALHHLFGECRFGFRQALATWAENPLASRGLREATELMVEHELARGEHAAADALLSEIPDPDPALRARVDALAARRAAQTAELATLRRSQQERDLQTGSRARSRYAFAIAALVVLFPLPVTIAERIGWYQASSQASVRFAALFFVLVAGGVWLGRRTLLANRANRSIVFAVMVALAARGGFRVIGNHWGLHLKRMVSYDLALLCVVMAMLAVLVDRRLGIAAGVYLVACALAVAAPPWSLLTLSVANVVALVIVGLVWRPAGSASAPGRQTPG